MRRFITAGAAVLAVSLAAGAGVAHATVAPQSIVTCMQPSTQAFLSVDGDQNCYFLAPGGSFENGAPGWTLAGGAAVTTGNNTARGAVAGTRSLSLPSGSTATSPLISVGALDPSIRFFARNAGASSSRLGVTVLFTLPNGRPSSLFVGAISGGSAWKATPAMLYLVNALANTSASGLTNVAFRFAPLDSTGHWSVDDVWVDPLKHR
jgi:hypothetical protein